MKFPLKTYVALALLCLGLASNIRLVAQGGQEKTLMVRPARGDGLKDRHP